MANEQRWREDRGYRGDQGGSRGDDGDRDWRRSSGSRAYEGTGYGGQSDWRGREGARWDQERSFAPRDYESEQRYGGGSYGSGRYGGENYGRYGEQGYAGGRYGGDGGEYGRGRYGGEGGDRGYGSGYGGGRGSYGYGGGMRESYGGRGQRDVGGFGDGGAYRQGYGGQDIESDQGWFGMSHGDHRGRGPKGYTRSDDRIRDDVQDRLCDDSWVDASDIDVTVDKGEVTLSGQVDSRNAKHRAETIVEDISGVKHVQNNLRIQESTTQAGRTSATTAGASGTGTTSSAAGSGTTGTSART